MPVLTGANGALRFNGAVVAKVRNWSLNVSRDALDTTCLSTTDREYVSGLRGATGSATVLYDPEEPNGAALLNTIFQDVSEPTDGVEFVLDQVRGKRLSGAALVTSVSPSVSVGDVQAADVQFQMSGKLTRGV